MTVDPSTRRVEAALKDGAMIQIAVWNVAPFFRWPKEEEVWTVRQDNGIWTLDSIVEQPQSVTIPIEGMKAGDARVQPASGGKIILAEGVQIPSGGAEGRLLQSDAAGNAEWTDILNGAVVGVAQGGVSVKSFGAKGDGVTDDTEAIIETIKVVLAAGGGQVFFPVGNYLVSSALVFTNLLHSGNIQLVGAGRRVSTITYTGTTGNLIIVRSCADLTFCDLGLRYNNPAYNGNLIDCDWSALNADNQALLFDRCMIGSSTALAVGARSLLRLNHTITSKVNDCQFDYGGVGIWLRDGGYAVSNTIQNCVFGLGRITTACIRNPGERCGIRDCTFEALANGKAGALLTDPGVASSAIDYTNNWHGDISTAGGNWMAFNDSCAGLGIHTNRFFTAGSGTNDASVYIAPAALITAVGITGNRFESKIGINCQGIMQGALISGNDFTLCVTAPIGASANVNARAVIQGNLGIANTLVP